jgi:hypothetical protein
MAGTIATNLYTGSRSEILADYLFSRRLRLADEVPPSA